LCEVIMRDYSGSIICYAGVLINYTFLHMPRQLFMLTFASALLTACATAAAAPATACSHDRARLLALDEAKFDQDMNDGWRTLGDTPGCELVAADLLRDYRQAHASTSSMLYWHEAQMRAMAGQSGASAALMERARVPAEEDPAGWNLYVDASVAFLRKDRTALDAAHRKLAAVAPMTGEGVPPLVDGFIELPTADGKTLKMRWPMNIDVVEGLQRCFEQPYKTAYGTQCRQGAAN
jgi:hypothetical protein